MDRVDDLREVVRDVREGHPFEIVAWVTFAGIGTYGLYARAPPDAMRIPQRLHLGVDAGR